MLVHIIEKAAEINPFKILIVVGKYESLIKDKINEFIDNETMNKIIFIQQKEALGTGHAIICAKKVLKTMREKNLLILSGDTPLIDTNLINNMFVNLKNFKICTTCLEVPFGYGRVFSYFNENKKITKIIEHNDCNEREININLINCGIYAFRIELLLKYLHMLSNNNNNNEYYITDLIEIIENRENLEVEMFKIIKEKNYLVLGVNTPDQLKQIEIFMKQLRNLKDNNSRKILIQ